MRNKNGAAVKKSVLAGAATSTKGSFEISKARKLVQILQRKLAFRLTLKSRRAGIGKQIRPLIDSLNATGRASTTASCQGHGWPFVRIFPYVVFKGDPVFAATLANLLQDDAMGKRSLHYVWRLEAYLDSEFRPNFKIWLAEGSPNRTILRQHLGADFVRLSNMAGIALQACRSHDSAHGQS